MGKGSRRRPGDALFRKNFDRIFKPGRKKLTSGTYVFQNGELVQGTVCKNDAHNMVSLAAGVMPEQVTELRKKIDQIGARGVKVRSDGNLVFKDITARKGYVKKAGLRDLNG